jgi:hypothetical protein
VKRANRFACLVAVTLFSLGLGPFAACLIAQGNNPPPQDIPFTVEGKIIDHSPGKITLSSGQNMEFDVHYDSTTEIQHQDGSPAKASELKDGIQIRVKGTLTEAGDIIAKQITIQPKAGSSKK